MKYVEKLSYYLAPSQTLGLEKRFLDCFSEAKKKIFLLIVNKKTKAI